MSAETPKTQSPATFPFLAVTTSSAPSSATARRPSSAMSDSTSTLRNRKPTASESTPTESPDLAKPAVSCFGGLSRDVYLQLLHRNLQHPVSWQLSCYY